MLTIEKKSVKVGHYVDTNYVDTLIRQYKQERWLENSNRIGKEDSLSIWYSLEELEGFIEKIKKHGANGVRFYFGEYPENFVEDPECAHRQTIVMVATKSKTDARDSKDLYVNDGDKTTILAYNYGSICPSICPGRTGDGDDWGGIGTTLVDRGEDGMLIV